ncbi:MAG: TetR family transcriptional regulator [Bdellovibrionales bacterium]
MESKKLQSTRSDKTIDSKQAIFKEAARLFATKGFNGTSVRDISKAANVNVALINYHFKTKQNLFNEVALYGFKRMETRKTTLRGMALDDMIDAIFRSNIDISDEGDGYYLIVVMDLFNSPQQLNKELASAIAGNAQGEWMEVVVQAVKECVPNNVPENELLSVAFMINGFLTWMSQVTFGIMGESPGFVGDLSGADDTEIRVNCIRDQAHRLVSELRTRYAS